MHEQHDALVEEPQRLGVVAADHLVDHLGQLLRAERFVGVQPAVDPDDRFAFPRECPRLLVGEAVGEREPARDVAVLRQILVIGRRGDDRHQVRPPFGRLADLLQDHPVGFGVELAPVVGDLRVVGELIVVAEARSRAAPWAW